MLHASEAYTIAKTMTIYLEELDDIERLIKEAATEGQYEIEIHRGYEMPFHPKTIEVLEDYDYTVKHYLDDYNRDYYKISWAL